VVETATSVLLLDFHHIVDEIQVSFSLLLCALKTEVPCISRKFQVKTLFLFMQNSHNFASSSYSQGWSLGSDLKHEFFLLALAWIHTYIVIKNGRREFVLKTEVLVLLVKKTPCKNHCQRAITLHCHALSWMMPS
jgi:hypothetical protein